jgi:vitamin B12 transporter
VEIQEETQRSFSESLSEMGPSSGQSRNRRSNRAFYAHVVKEGVGWSGNAGVRTEDNEQYGAFLTYQVGASMTVPGIQTRFRGTIGKGFKEPAFTETSSTSYTVGNPELRPEQSRSWEVGLDQPVAGTAAHLSLTWFDQTLRDLIQYTFLPPEPEGPNFFNVAKARSRGLEATARIPLGASLLSVGYSLLDTKVLNAGFDEGEGAVFVEGEALIRRPRHQVSLTGRGPIPRGHLFGSVRWVSERVDRDFTGWPARSVELSPFLLLGMGGEVSLREARGRWPAVDFRVRVENLLDKGYQEVFGYPAPGRAFLVGGSVRMGG